MNIPKFIPAFKRSPIVAAAVAASILASAYWGFIASDRYVSEAHVLVQRTDLAAGARPDLSGLIAGASGSTVNRADQLLLRNHLMSLDMVKKLDKKLDLRGHFSSKQADIFSRMWDASAPAEVLHEEFLRRVSIELDEYSGVLVISAQGFDPRTAHAITDTLVQEGEAFMNRIAQELVASQVTFLQAELVGMNQKVMETRQAVIDYQNTKGIASPEMAVTSLAEITAKLEARRAELQTQIEGMLSYLVADHPSVVMARQQLAAVESQIRQENAKLATPKGRALNATLEQYQRLQMQAKFAQEVYQTALAAAEKGRIEATRMLKKVQVIQAASVPEHPLEPQRIYNVIAFWISALVVAGALHLLLAIVRDHKD